MVNKFWASVILLILISTCSAAGCDFKVLGPFEAEFEGNTFPSSNGSLAFAVQPLSICEPGKSQITLTWSYNITINSTGQFSVVWSPALSLVRNDGYVGFISALSPQSLTQASDAPSFGAQTEISINQCDAESFLEAVNGSSASDWTWYVSLVFSNETTQVPYKMLATFKIEQADSALLNFLSFPLYFGSLNWTASFEILNDTGSPASSIAIEVSIASGSISAAFSQSTLLLLAGACVPQRILEERSVPLVNQSANSALFAFSNDYEPGRYYLAWVGVELEGVAMMKLLLSNATYTTPPPTLTHSPSPPPHKKKTDVKWIVISILAVALLVFGLGLAIYTLRKPTEEQSPLIN